MFKKIVVSGLVVFILWAVIGFVVNGVILRSAYEATAELWRPMAEMKWAESWILSAGDRTLAGLCLYHLGGDRRPRSAKEESPRHSNPP